MRESRHLGWLDVHHLHLFYFQWVNGKTASPPLPILIFSYKMPSHYCDRECHGRHLPGGDSKRKKAMAPSKEPLPEYGQIRNEALGAQDRQACLAADAIPKRLIK